MHYSEPRFCISCMAGIKFTALVVNICFSGPSGQSQLWEGFVVSNQYRCTILVWDAQFRQDNQSVTTRWCMLHISTGGFRCEERAMKRTIICCVSPRTVIETWTLECVFYKKYSGCCDMAKVLCILCTGSVVHIHQTLCTSTSVPLLRAGYCLFCAQIRPCCLILSYNTV